MPIRFREFMHRNIPLRHSSRGVELKLNLARGLDNDCPHHPDRRWLKSLKELGDGCLSLFCGLMP